MIEAFLLVALVVAIWFFAKSFPIRRDEPEVDYFGEEEIRQGLGKVERFSAHGLTGTITTWEPPPRHAPAPRDPDITEHATFALGATKVFAAHACKVDHSTPIAIEPDPLRPGHYLAKAAGLGTIGRITARHPVAAALNRGDRVLQATINSFNDDIPDAPVVRLRVVTGPEGKIFTMPGPRTYSIALVGEQHYQKAVRKLTVGDLLVIVHEPDNPYDTEALAVRTEVDAPIGYLTRDCFIRDVVHEEGGGCRATVEKIEHDRRGQGFLHVTIAAEKCAGPIEQRPYKRG